MTLKLKLFGTFFLLLLSLSSHARDYLNEPAIPWSQNGAFDFCPNTKAFDFRNAYWLAAMSYYSYWHPSYLEQIFTAPVGTPIEVPIQEGDAPVVKTTTYGLGWKGHLDFFTSAPQLPRSPKTYNDHHTSYFTAPLPYEACVKPEKLWCFGIQNRGAMTKDEIEKCGANIEKALMDRQRLQNIHHLMRGTGDLSSEEQIRAQRDWKSIDKYVKTYEQKKGLALDADPLDPQFAERCEIYHMDNNFTPDVQAVWIESSEMVILAIRGTEVDNIVDWTTDFATSFQLNHKFLPFWKRNVHKGYEQSFEVMSPWLQNEVNALFKRYPHAAQIPIFVTGHSMGGALATLVMTSFLERNQKVSPDTKLNLKAVYTFGAPRIGNLTYAKYFEDLNRNEQVGFYRIVNQKDPVPRAPCIDYAHFGTNVQINSSQTLVGTSSLHNVTVNPNPDDYNYCAYGTSLLDNLVNIKKYLRQHYLESYHNLLWISRYELQRALQTEEINYKLANGIIGNTSTNPYSYPNNCSAASFRQGNGPEYLQNNYKVFPQQIEH